MAAPLVKHDHRERADQQHAQGCHWQNSHKATELTELPICERSGPDEGNNKQQHYKLSIPDLWFTDNVISFLGRRVCGKAV